VLMFRFLSLLVVTITLSQDQLTTVEQAVLTLTFSHTLLLRCGSVQHDFTPLQ
jgi:hypothetical protein